MQNVAQINLKSLAGQQAGHQMQTKSVNVPSGAISAVNQLFIQLRAIFPAWKNSFPDEASYREAKRIWLEALVSEKITTIEQLQNGIDRAKKSKNPFWPSVGEFIEWCNTIDYKLLGLPTEDDLARKVEIFSSFGMEELAAYQSKFGFASSAEYWLITGLYCNRKNKEWNEQTYKNQLKKELSSMAKRIMAGEKISDPTLSLTAEVETPPPPEEVINKRFAELKAKMGIKQ